MTKYFAATMSDGQTVVRSSASRTYTHAVAVKWKDYSPELWRASWAGSLSLALKNQSQEEKKTHNIAVERAVAREVTAAEYRQLKAAIEAKRRAA